MVGLDGPGKRSYVSKLGRREHSTFLMLQGKTVPQSKSNRDGNSQGKLTQTREGMTDDRTNERATIRKTWCWGRGLRDTVKNRDRGRSGSFKTPKRKGYARMKANKPRGKGNKRTNGLESGKQPSRTTRLPAAVTQPQIELSDTADMASRTSMWPKS